MRKCIRFDNPNVGPELKDTTIGQIIIQMSAAGAYEGSFDLDVKRTSGKVEHWRFTFRKLRKVVKHGEEAENAG